MPEPTPAIADLAKRYSEDVSSAAQGGSLGGLRSGDLYLAPQLLDALAELSPGAVSRVIETPAGFHILRRLERPPQTDVSGARIVIGYDGATALPEQMVLPQPSRTRAEALALAGEIYTEAARGADAFGTLVERYSEHRDKLSGGDIGSWSRWEPTMYPKELEVLSGLSVGEIAPPLDSLYGIEILQRTSDRAPQPYALLVARIRFDPNSAESEQRVAEEAELLSQKFGKKPAEFDAFRSARCCRTPERWYQGRDIGFTSDIAQLGIGELATRIAREYNTYAIVKRVGLDQLPPLPPVSFGVPSPDGPDLDDIVINASSWAAVMDEMQSVADRAAASAALSPEAAAGLRSLVQRSRAEDSGMAWRVRALHDVLAAAERLLGNEYPTYRRLLNLDLERLVLKPDNVELVRNAQPELTR